MYQNEPPTFTVLCLARMTDFFNTLITFKVQYVPQVPNWKLCTFHRFQVLSTSNNYFNTIHITRLHKSLLLHTLLTNYKSIKETVSPQLTAKENLPPQNKAHDA